MLAEGAVRSEPFSLIGREDTGRCCAMASAVRGVRRGPLSESGPSRGKWGYRNRELTGSAWQLGLRSRGRKGSRWGLGRHQGRPHTAVRRDLNSSVPVLGLVQPGDRTVEIIKRQLGTPLSRRSISRGLCRWEACTLQRHQHGSEVEGVSQFEIVCTRPTARSCHGKSMHERIRRHVSWVRSILPSSYGWVSQFSC
jgi:hypothetical protein